MSNIKGKGFERIHSSLRIWFIIHFIADISFAIPIMLMPVTTLRFLGWEMVDPFAARLVAAALFGIGIESFLGRNAGCEAFKGMLNLKIIWSAGAIIGIILSLVEGTHGRPLVGWIILVIFIAFNILWTTYRVLIGKVKEYT